MLPLSVDGGRRTWAAGRAREAPLTSLKVLCPELHWSAGSPISQQRSRQSPPGAAQQQQRDGGGAAAIFRETRALRAKPDMCTARVQALRRPGRPPPFAEPATSVREALTCRAKLACASCKPLTRCITLHPHQLTRDRSPLTQVTLSTHGRAVQQSAQIRAGSRMSCSGRQMASQISDGVRTLSLRFTVLSDSDFVCSQPPAQLELRAGATGFQNGVWWRILVLAKRPFNGSSAERSSPVHLLAVPGDERHQYQEEARSEYNRSAVTSTHLVRRGHDVRVGLGWELSLRRGRRGWGAGRGKRWRRRQRIGRGRWRQWQRPRKRRL